MKIKLDLRKHCIETEVKRLYNRALSNAFKNTPPDTIMEQRIDHLKTALETLDFGFLRKEFPILAGHHDDDVILSFDDAGTIHILINGRPIKQ